MIGYVKKNRRRQLGFRYGRVQQCKVEGKDCERQAYGEIAGLHCGKSQNMAELQIQKAPHRNPKTWGTHTICLYGCKFLDFGFWYSFWNFVCGGVLSFGILDLGVLGFWISNFGDLVLWDFGF